MGYPISIVLTIIRCRWLNGVSRYLYQQSIEVHQCRPQNFGYQATEFCTGSRCKVQLVQVFCVATKCAAPMPIPRDHTTHHYNSQRENCGSLSIHCRYVQYRLLDNFSYKLALCLYCICLFLDPEGESFRSNTVQ